MYRVFISYSHEDYEIVKKLANILKENGLTPIWDENFQWGHDFPEQIKICIAHAHVFIFVLSKASSERGWVHQEIGYAAALNIPTLPLALDSIPQAMLQSLHALRWDSDINIVKQKLSLKTFDNLIKDARINKRPLFECAQTQEERAFMIAEYATKVSHLGFYGYVRQKGECSSFNIPDKPINHPYWQLRYSPNPPNDFRYRSLSQERRALWEHARKCGCSLIINPYMEFPGYQSQARIVRLKGLLEFLESMSDDRLKVAISKDIPISQNLIIVGDWIVAEAVFSLVGTGYRQTIFTRHAPTIQSKIKEFDEELNYLLKKEKNFSRLIEKICSEKIKEILKELESK